MSFAGPSSSPSKVNAALEQTNQGSLRDRLFAKMRGKSGGGGGKTVASNLTPGDRSGGRRKNEDGDWTRRNSANASTNWIKSLSETHKGYHSEKRWEHSVTDKGRDLSFKRGGRSPEIRGHIARPHSSSKIQQSKKTPKWASSVSRLVKSTPRRKGTRGNHVKTRFHKSKADLLGFTGDEKLHQEYEKQRIDHHGGAHDIVDADGRGGFNSWGPKTYKIEERIATKTTNDNLSNYQRNRKYEDIRVPLENSDDLSGRFDPDLLASIVENNSLASTPNSPTRSRFRKDAAGSPRRVKTGKEVIARLRKQLGGYDRALRKRFRRIDRRREGFVSEHQFNDILQGFGVTLTKLESVSLLERLEAGGRVDYEAFLRKVYVHIESEIPKKRIHRRKASLLGFTGDEDLHNEYERQRVEHRGGAHDVVQASSTGELLTWGSKTFKTEEQVALHTTDDRSYYQRNRDFEKLKVPLDGANGESSVKGRFDASLLDSMMGGKKERRATSTRDDKVAATRAARSSARRRQQRHVARVKQENRSSTESSASRDRIRPRKASLLGFKGNDRLQREYESRRSERRGGAHEIVEVDGHGKNVAWGAKTYSLEQMVEVGASDERSYFQRNRDRAPVKVPDASRESADGRFDATLLSRLMRE